MKYRYLGFSSMMYYPGGGMSDCVIKSNNLDEVKTKLIEDAKQPFHSGCEIYDCETGEEIEFEYSTT